jgi:hypothetical protein
VSSYVGLQAVARVEPRQEARNQSLYRLTASVHYTYVELNSVITSQKGVNIWVVINECRSNRGVWCYS